MKLYKFDVSSGELLETNTEDTSEFYDKSTRELLLRALGYKESVIEAYNSYLSYFLKQQASLIDQKKYIERDIDDLHKTFERIQKLVDK